MTMRREFQWLTASWQHRNTLIGGMWPVHPCVFIAIYRQRSSIWAPYKMECRFPNSPFEIAGSISLPLVQPLVAPHVLPAISSVDRGARPLCRTVYI